MYHFQVNCGHFPFHTYSCHQCQIVYKEIAALWKNFVSFLNGTAAILKWRFQLLHWVLKRAHTLFSKNMSTCEKYELFLKPSAAVENAILKWRQYR